MPITPNVTDVRDAYILFQIEADKESARRHDRSPEKDPWTVFGAEFDRWRVVNRAIIIEGALKEFVIEGVCLSCGGAVGSKGEHIDEERHQQYTLRAMEDDD